MAYFNLNLIIVDYLWARSGTFFNLFLFIKNKPLFISSEGFSEGNAAHPVWVWQPTSVSNGRLAHFFLYLNLLDLAWQPYADSNGRLARFKGYVTTRYRKIVVRKSRHIVSWKQFWVNDVWTLLEQKSPLMNKTELMHFYSKVPKIALGKSK